MIQIGKKKHLVEITKNEIVLRSFLFVSSLQRFFCRLQFIWSGSFWRVWGCTLRCLVHCSIRGVVLIHHLPTHVTQPAETVCLFPPNDRAI